MTHLDIARSINAATYRSQANTRHGIKLALVTAFGAVMAGTVAMWPMPVERTYDLVQIDATGESEIVDYNLSATDCGQFRDRLANRGFHVLCERSN